ncbi:MAG: L7Ae/L30e/S12e/Gadd45 family ribosomal protein [bacterium]|jgi:ribosomal protein L7Ae-like RNA K-turn-binding protein
MSVLSLIGLACRAGKLAIGDQAVKKALRLSQVFLVVLAKDSSQRTRRSFINYSDTAGVPVVEISTKTLLGQRLGRNEVAVTAITDLSLAKAVISKLKSVESKKLRG